MRLAAAIVIFAQSLAWKAAATDHGHGESLTFSPLRGFGLEPLLDVTWEHALERRYSVAAVGGWGRHFEGSSERDGTERSHRISVYEVGAQYRRYAIGSFDHGLQVGAEALYVYADGDKSREIYWAGLSAGPFVGYKKSARFGLTFDAQIGLAYRVFPPGYDEDDEVTNPGGDNIEPLLNLNIGWAF